MQRIVCDTNVIVSALIQRGYPYRIVYDLFISGEIQFCISEPLLKEYIDVLKRDKFSRYPDFFTRSESLLVDIKNKSALFIPQTTVDIISDKADNVILELAAECSADFIITGNTTDFTFSEYKGTKIVTPKEYWENYQIF
jgi:putative PIN family toxin of toxin-antitoxin system